MVTLGAIARTKATLVWFGLVAATTIAGIVGGDHGSGDGRVMGAIVLLIAFVKVRLVGLYFMELRDAPPALRLGFEAYCALTFSAVVAIYLAA